MCRSIVRLRDGREIAESEAMDEAALQFVRKISGFSKPAEHNREVFERAVAEISASSQQLMEDLVIRGR
ncbi:MAG: DUF2277 family protein [Acidimicrobiia bacterium]|nr:DUF2277 family protein [Acidimicrobiia bacterium]